MEAADVKLAMAQLSPTTGDLDGNARKIAEAIREARRRGCELVVAPETAITGYLSCDLLEVDAYVRRNKALLGECIAPETDGIAAVVGFVDCETGPGGAVTRRYNAAALVRNGRVEAVAHKQNLCRYRYYDETRYFTPGAATTLAEVPLGGRPRRVAMLICEDIWDGPPYDGSPCAEAREAGAELTVVLNASPFESGKWQSRLETIRGPRPAPLPLLYVNTVGIGDNLKDLILFDGRSLAFDGRGRMTACAPLFGEELTVVELDEELNGAETVPPACDPQEELHAALSFALRQYCRQSGFARAVVGVSGGVDSALVASLAAEALGRENVLGVNMPSRYSSEGTRNDAAAVCANLGIEHAVMPIDGLYGEVVGAFGRWHEPSRSVTRQNFQARLRGLLLMGISNETDRLVIASGNKTELGLGYCTLYGDMVGGLLLIGDLNKMQVYQLAEHVNRRAGREIIPASVLERVPSAELEEDQQDPFDYPVVAPIVDDIIAREDPEAIVDRFRNRELGPRYAAEVYERYDEAAFASLVAETDRLYRRSAFKRSQASPIVIVSRRALGFDLRETIINWWCRDVGGSGR